jgi:hypothetical protein
MSPRTAQELFAAAPWRRAPIETFDPRFPPGCLNPTESSLLTVLARDYFIGAGAIVDAGSFLGKSAVLFAHGLRENPRIRSQPWIHAFDWFRIVDDHDVAFVRDVTGDTLAIGARTRRLFDANVMRWADLIEVHDGDFTNAVWNGAPIEILFLDICKSESLNRRVIEQFFPALIPGRSIVIQQDYHHAHHPYIHVTLERLAHFLLPLASRIDDSYVCQLRESIPADVLEDAANAWSLPVEQRLALLNAAIHKLPESQRLFVTLARAILRGEYEEDPHQIDVADRPNGSASGPRFVCESKSY